MFNFLIRAHFIVHDVITRDDKFINALLTVSF